MNRYRKLPVEIQAVQFTDETRDALASEAATPAKIQKELGDD